MREVACRHGSTAGLSGCPGCVEDDHWETQERRAARGDPYDAVYFGPALMGRLARAARERADDARIALMVRHDVDPEVGWTDAQYARALAHYGLPSFARLPDGPGHNGKRRRVNAAHLLGHVVRGDGRSCWGCRDWGAR